MNIEGDHVTKQRKRIPEAIYLVVRDMGKPYQRVQAYWSLHYAQIRADEIDGKLFAIPTYTMEEL